MARKYIDLKTAIPGPKSREWLEEKDRWVARAWEVHAPVIIDHGKGALVTDIDGNTFIDMTGGIGCLNVGHAHPKVVDAIKEQVEKSLHTDFTIIPYDSLIQLAKRLCEVAPGPSQKKAVFFNSGAEAVENAVKIAKKYTGKKAFISFEGAFHGRTMMAMSLTSKPHPYKAGFGPFAPDIHRIPYAYCYRCPINKEYPGCGVQCADILKRAFKSTASPDQVAAVVVEPVQGEGGFIAPPKEYLAKLASIAADAGVLMIVDEVQTGFGRTGKLFASEHSGIEPDLMPVAKSIAAGIPLSAVVGKAEIVDAPDSNTIGGTYVGNPVGCVAALKVLDVIEEENLVERASALGDLVMKRYHEMYDRYEIIGDVRGLGMMNAMELVKDRKTKEPASEATSKVMALAMERGVLPLMAGIWGNVIRALTPLVITEGQLNEGLDVLEECIAVVDNENKAVS